MTTAQAARPAATKTARPAAGAVRARRGLAKRAGRLAEGAAARAFAVVATYPKTTAALTAAVTATTPVTLRDVSGAVVASSVGISAAWFGSRSRTESWIDILPTMSTYRKRARRIRRRWPAVMASAGLVQAPVYPSGVKRKPRIMRMRPTPTGVRAWVAASSVAAGPADFAKVSDKLRNGFGCLDVKVDQHKHLTMIDFMWVNPLAKPTPVTQLPAPTRRGYVTVGVTEGGTGLEKDPAASQLIVGTLGAGKSSEVWAMLYGLQRAGIPHRVRVFDPKGGQEFGELEDAAWKYERNPLNWPDFVSTALAGMQKRLESLRSRGKRTHTPTWSEPLDIMLIDELLTALAFDRVKKAKIGGKEIAATEAFKVYLSQCRSAGYSVWALSQLGQADVIGNIRGLFPYASLLRVGPAESALVDVILGSGARNAYPAHLLPVGRTSAGVGWARTEVGVDKYRGGWASDAVRSRVALRMKADRDRLKPPAEEATP